MARLRLLGLWLVFALASPVGASPLDRWHSEVAGASARFGVPKDWILRVMRVESHGVMDARSDKGAMGLMQLMPRTWDDMRLRLGLGDNPYDPHDNILAGTFYLRLLYDRFGYPGLLAAYNAGPARYADGLAGRRALPLETRAYVAAIAPPGAIFASDVDALPKPSARLAVQPTRATLFFPLSTRSSGQ